MSAVHPRTRRPRDATRARTPLPGGTRSIRARSFLVQAPAGSGKTELLTQRLLALLAHVDRPERDRRDHVHAQGGGEMRERIVRALGRRGAPTRRRIAVGAPALTANSRRRALAQDARQGWQLLEHPRRLRVADDRRAVRVRSRERRPARERPRRGAADARGRRRALYARGARRSRAADAGRPGWRDAARASRQRRRRARRAARGDARPARPVAAAARTRHRQRRAAAAASARCRRIDGERGARGERAGRRVGASLAPLAAASCRISAARARAPAER